MTGQTNSRAAASVHKCMRDKTLIPASGARTYVRTYAAISIGSREKRKYMYTRKDVRERRWKRRKNRGRDGTRAGQMRRTEEQWAGIRWKLTFLHAELTPPITPTRRGVLGLHEVLIVLRQTRQRRSALVVTLAPLLFANLHTTRCSARERGAR